MIVYSFSAISLSNKLSTKQTYLYKNSRIPLTLHWTGSNFSYHFLFKFLSLHTLIHLVHKQTCKWAIWCTPQVVYSGKQTTTNYKTFTTFLYFSEYFYIFPGWILGNPKLLSVKNQQIIPAILLFLIWRTFEDRKELPPSFWYQLKHIENQSRST